MKQNIPFLSYLGHPIQPHRPVLRPEFANFEEQSPFYSHPCFSAGEDQEEILLSMLAVFPETCSYHLGWEGPHPFIKKSSNNQGS